MKSYLIVVSVLLCLLSVHSTFAQGVVDSRTPTWQDFESLTRRLDAMETENQWLRSYLEGPRHGVDVELRQAVSNPNSTTYSNATWNNGSNDLAPPSCTCGCYPCQCPPTPAPCIDCPHVSTLSPYFNLRVFGSLTGEVLYAEARPIIPSGIILLSPDLGQDTETAEVHAKSSSLGIAFTGPEILGLKSGGTFLTYLYGETFQADNYGLYIVRAFADLKNESMRLAMGLEGDVINPLSPGTINYNAGNGAGNLGFFRGQFRVERYFHFGDDRQLTAQFSLSDPVATSFDDFVRPPIHLLETNGWPNIEGRLAIGLGTKQPGQSRPFEMGVSGLVGELRRTDVIGNHIYDVWAFGSDVHLAFNDFVGFNGEFFTGQAIGNYNAAIIQIDNTDFAPIRSTGGWGEIYVHWTPCLHSHFGYSIDDPLDSTLTVGLPTRNEFAFANLIWDVTKNLEVGFEVSHWETSYTAPVGDNDAMVYHTRVRLKF